MKRIAVIIGLFALTMTGCVADSKATQPIAPPQVVAETPTYQGVTQYDYRAGAPEYTEDTAQTDNTTQATPAVPAPPTVPFLNITGGGSSGRAASYWPPYYYTPPAPAPVPAPAAIIIIEGTVTTAKEVK